MPVKKRAGKGSGAASLSVKRKIPVPFKRAPDSLAPFVDQLDIRECYVTHIDSCPASFKRKIFSVPVLLNLGVVLLFVLRVWYISPFYFQLFESGIAGKVNATTLVAKHMTWSQLIAVVLRRGFTFMLDMLLAIFVWPWPVEFCFGTRHGNPVGWRLKTGFRDREVYVRRSREWYSSYKTAVATSEESIGKKVTSTANPQLDFVNDEEARRVLLAHIAQATSPLLTQQKTGYLTMDGNWDLDWDLMVWATHLVDKKEVELDAFASVALVYDEEFGWLTVEGASGGHRPEASSPAEDARRKQVFKFRDALSALGKEQLFYRWIEIIQYETTRPGGIGDSKRQEEVAKQVREEFMAKGVDFDKLWAETVGTDGLFGM